MSSASSSSMMLNRAVNMWREAHLVVALTGAGVSVASGIPDFRSPGGLWSRWDPAEVAAYQSLRARPKRVWEFLVDAVLVFDQARPNPGHFALAKLEREGLLAAVITQNIDNLHQEAGSRRVLEFHGNGKRYYCMDCRKEYDPARIPGLSPEELPWRCEACQGVIRPDFVFFGEHIPPGVLSESLRLTREADLCLIAGTSGEVAPANTLPQAIKANGGKVIEVNLGRTAFGDLPDLRFDAKTEELLPELCERLTGERP